MPVRGGIFGEGGDGGGVILKWWEFLVDLCFWLPCLPQGIEVWCDLSGWVLKRLCCENTPCRCAQVRFGVCNVSLCAVCEVVCAVR